MVFGLVLLVASDALAKLLLTDYPVSQVIGVRASLVAVAILFVAGLRGRLRRLKPVHPLGHLVRGGLALLSSWLFILGLAQVSLVNAAAAAYTGPLFLTALAPWLLSERVGWFRWTAVFVGFAGTIIMLRPTADGLDWPLLLPASAAFCGALRDLVTRRISVSEDPMSILFSSNLLLAVVGLLVCIAGWVSFSLTDWLLIGASGLLIAIAHFLHILAFKYAEAATIAPWRYSSIIWSALLGFLIWGDSPSSHILLGGSIVMACGLVIFYRERRLQPSVA